MKLTFQNGEFIARAAYDEREIPRKAAFCWSPERKTWYTTIHRDAARLRAFADESAKKELNRILIHVTPWAGGIPVPKDQRPLPFQNPAAKFLLERNRAYLAADPGLGKTIIACMVMNALHAEADEQEERWNFVYVCPPFLTRTVAEELHKWCKFPARLQVLIVADSMFWRTKGKAQVEKFLAHGEKRFALFVDEAHRYKNAETQRGRALFGDEAGAPGLLSRFPRAYFLSGTPMPNRPLELWPVLHHAAPETINFMRFFDYGRRYCGAVKNDFGWDFSGASNLEELFTAVKSKFMLRIKKADVLKDLPPKLEELVFLSDDMSAQLSKMDAAVLRSHSPEDLMHGKLSTEVELEPGKELHTATYRRLLGKEKVPGAVEYIHNLLTDTDESLLVFAHHTEVIDALAASLRKWRPFVIKGGVSMGERHAAVKAFQAGASRLFILNYTAGGVGLTLTRATRVIFVEFDWVPATNDQASDRAHRIGQTDSVTAQYLIFRNSLDRAVMETVFGKKRNQQHL